jgi:hypothetical protein
MLEKLKVLDLSLNGFQFFPEIVTYLSSLEKLILSTVEIYSVPQTVLYLENLQILDLRDTPLVDKTNDVDNFGYIKLRENFGSRLIFSEPPSEQGSNLFEDLFKHLKPPRTTFINRKRFKQIKLPALAFPATPSFDVLLDQINIISNSLNLDDPSQPSTYVSFQSLVGYDNLNLIFGDKIEAHMDLDGATNKETFNKLLRPRLTGYIKNLYGIPLDVNESIGHQMKEENKREAQQLFSFIINKILNVPPENQISLFSQLVNGILNCATGQMEAFNTLVLALINPKEEIQNQTNLSESVTASETMEISDVNKTILFPNTFEGHLQHQITIIKNNVLQQVILEKAVNHDQNNHLIAKYRQLLSKTLGLSLIGSTFVDTVFLSNNDPFFNNKENVLNCFYEHLSPEYLCLELMKCAESKEDILSKKSSLSGFITNHKNIDERPFTAQRVGLYLLQRGLIEDETEQWKSFFDEDPFKADNTAVITYDGMMEILLHEGIIYKKTPSSSNKKPRIVESFPTTYLDLP